MNNIHNTLNISVQDFNQKHRKYKQIIKLTAAKLMNCAAYRIAVQTKKISNQAAI